MKFKDWLLEPINLDDIFYNTNLDPIDRKELNLRDSGFIPEPIGVSLQLNKSDLETINNLTFEQNINNQLMYYSFATATDKNRTSGAIRKNPSMTRSLFMTNLKKNGFNYRGVRGKGYLINMCRAKFAPSPEGNGIDCHRHWEALYCKCIPIIEDNEQMKTKLIGLPVIYTKDYSEITTEFLNQKYQQILETDYDFSKLFLSGYKDDIQERIKIRSNYWCNKFKKPIFYDT